MAYKVTGEGYSAFFREEEDGREVEADDIDDGYTCLLCNTSYEKGRPTTFFMKPTTNCSFYSMAPNQPMFTSLFLSARQISS